MSELVGAERALFSGDFERAKSLAVQSFDSSPGKAAVLLGHVALAQDDFPRAEMLGRTALENFEEAGVSILADAIGSQGRRGDAEKICLDAVSRNADSGLLRAVLGEQRVRQAKWDLGTQDFIDALSLDERPYVLRHLWRVLGDLANGHKAGKVPAARALEFIARLESSAPRGDGNLVSALTMARSTIERGGSLPTRMPQAPIEHAPPPQARPSAPPPPQRSGDRLVMGGPRRVGKMPDLVATMRRDRELNESLQDGLGDLGLPTWPSRHTRPIDDIEAMQPKLLQIDREEFQREHLNVTSGSVAAEIVIERALQAMLSPEAVGITRPTFDATGLTQLEIAMWDGIFDRVRPISPVYLADVPESNQSVLALGAFMGGCVVFPGVATWSFDPTPARSSIETAHRDLHPFKKAQDWFDAADKDDVSLEEFLFEAQDVTQSPSRSTPKHDTTNNLKGAALSMRLAELWMLFRRHAPAISQHAVAQSIRPLVVNNAMIIFAIARDFTPPINPTSRRRETAVAYVRRTGEFLMLESRKHFARAAGLYCGSLSFQSSARALDLFSMYHRPGSRVFGPGQGAAKPETRKGRALLQFTATIDGDQRHYALVHAPRDYVKWSLLEIE